MLSKFKNIIHDFNAKREYKKYIPKIHDSTKNLTADQLVDFVLSPEWERFFWMMQIPSEIKFLLNKVEKLKPKVVLEIGTKSGSTLFLFTKMASENARIHSIDFPDGLGGGYTKSRSYFYRLFATKKQHIELIYGDSHKQSTKELLLSKLNNDKIDFAFIDGDHSYEGVKKDFEMYAPLVRTGGMIAFHDNKPTEGNSWSGVIQFWEEIKDKYKTEEFFGKEDETWGGIGIVFL